MRRKLRKSAFILCAWLTTSITATVFHDMWLTCTTVGSGKQIIITITTPTFRVFNQGWREPSVNYLIPPQYDWIGNGITLSLTGHFNCLTTKDDKIETLNIVMRLSKDASMKFFSKRPDISHWHHNCLLVLKECQNSLLLQLSLAGYPSEVKMKYMDGIRAKSFHTYWDPACVDTHWWKIKY